MIIRPSTTDPFFLNLDTQFQKGYSAAEPTYQKWTQVVQSTGASTLHAWLDKIPKVREWVGPRDVQNLISQSYSLTNKLWELTFGVKRTDFEDDLFNLYGPSAQMLGMQAADLPDDQMTTVLEAGASTLTFDGANFFSASHPVDTANSSAGTQANLLTSTAFTATNVAAADTAFMKLKGRDGKPFGTKLTHVMVPPALKHKAMQAANAEFLVASDGLNAATGGASNVLKGTFDVIVNPKLTSDTTWYAFDLRWPIKGLIWQSRMAPEFDYIVNPTNADVFKDDMYYYGTRIRGVGGYGLWFMCLQCTA